MEITIAYLNYIVAKEAVTPAFGIAFNSNASIINVALLTLEASLLYPQSRKWLASPRWKHRDLGPFQA